MGLTFLAAGLALALSPWRWKKKLARTDYFITNRRVFLMEGDAERFFRWEDSLSLRLQRHDGRSGSIYLARQSRLLNRLFGPARAVAAETDETGKSNGLLNIPDAESIYALMESLAHPEENGPGSQSPPLSLD